MTKMINHLIMIMLLLLCIASMAIPTFAHNASRADSIHVNLFWEYSSSPYSCFSVEYDNQNKPYFYVTAGEGGLLIFNASNPSQPALVKTFPTSDFTSLHVMNVFQQDNYLYLALGGHFVNGQPEKGLAILDVSDPANATITDVWHAMPGKGSAIVLVEGDYAYLGAMSQGVVILDVSDKNDVQFVSQIIPDINFPWPNPNQSQKDKINARGMALQDNTLYLCYDAGGLRVIDISDKANPRETGRYLNTAVELMAYNNIALNGSLAYVPIDYCGMEVLDISDTTNITQVGWWNPWDCDHPLDWFDNDGHTNEIIFNEQQDLVFLSAGDSELIVADVSDPAKPRLAGSFGEPKNMQGAWGVEVHNQMIVLTYIRTFGIPFRSTWGGVKLLEWDNITGIEENSDLPQSFVLHLNYPNPFNPSTVIGFQLPVNIRVELAVYSITGQLVRTLVSGEFVSGRHEVVWDATDNAGKRVASGVYLAKMQAGKFLRTRKLILMK